VLDRLAHLGGDRREQADLRLSEAPAARVCGR
jgi:hypothetical protein